MSDSKLPPLSDLTVGKAHRLICADYLRTMAKLLEQDAVDAFELNWNTSFQKPNGKIVANASFLTPPMEMQFVEAIAKHREEQAKQIPIVDITEEMQENHPDIVERRKDDPNLS